MSSKQVELGFAEKSPSWKLRSKFFRSKIGGLPSWLCLNELPQLGDLKCKSCGKVNVFLLQVYAPFEEREDAFHRTIFVFMCSDGKCNNRNKQNNFVVFRSQLPRKNEFYSFEPPNDVEAESRNPSANQFQTLCEICGCKATLKCEKCNKRDYCSKHHLDLDLSQGHSNCGSSDASAKKKKKLKTKFLLQEFEMVTETEDIPPAAPEKSDEVKMREYHQFMKSSKAPKELQDAPLDDLDQCTRKSDKFFNKFRKRVDHEPEQVLRYQRGGTPLWVSSEHIPTEKNIPCCPCGAPRVFEFQVMPQLLNHLSLDAVENSIDWGSLFIYTCSNSCEKATGGYSKEFIWKQDFTNDVRS